MIQSRVYLGMAVIALVITSCKTPDFGRQDENNTVPESYNGSQDTTNTASQNWSNFYSDKYLTALIDSALVNNQELNIMMQEISIANNDILEKKGEYLPKLGVQAGAGVDKVGRYTSHGAFEATTEIEPGKEMPEPVPDFIIGAKASWEIDIWRQLRNGRDAATKRYLASVEGKNFMVTNLVAEIARSYYELLALDNQLAIVQQNIEIQSNALEIVRLQKFNGKTTELAVKKFEAEVFNTRSMQFEIRQNIVEVENRINFLVGRFPQHVDRSDLIFLESIPVSVQAGIPSQLLDNRPDIRQAELMLQASKLDIKIAKADFYPKLALDGGIGLNAFNPSYIIRPQSMLYNVAGNLVAPLINRNAIKAKFYSANQKQIQAMYEYEMTLLNAHIEVANQLSNIDNLNQAYALKEQQVDALTQSIEISNSLFKSARADYMEILMTQRDALEAKFDLIETKLAQMNATVNIYQALGGGWN